MTLRWWRREELRCKEVGQLLQSFLDGELDELASRQVARHLDDCRRCGMESETYEEIKRAFAPFRRPPAGGRRRPSPCLRPAAGRRLVFLPDERQQPAGA